jgi:hypothetical protein
VGRHRRLRDYDEADFDLLVQIVETASQVIVTQHVLTEASNLLGLVGEPIRTHVARVFQAFIRSVEERVIESRLAVDHAEFPNLWLTDSALLVELEKGHVLLTADLDLYLAAARRGHQVVNFNHIRPQ